MWASTSAVSRPHTDTSIAAATSSDCEYRKWVRIRKKPRKNTTKASRRARSSSVLSAIRLTIIVTPASLPSRVWCVHSVRPAASTSAAISTQRPGNAAFVNASHARQASTTPVSTLHHTGKCDRCGSTVQPITASRNKVSRASRGRRCQPPVRAPRVGRRPSRRRLRLAASVACVNATTRAPRDSAGVALRRQPGRFRCPPAAGRSRRRCGGRRAPRR